MTPDDITRLLGLEPLDPEGGFFAETYRATTRLPLAAGERTLSTAIYYLLTPETLSAMHRIRSDEVFHFYMGDAVEMLHLHPDGSGREVVLGVDLSAGQRPQVIVAARVWQGARLRAGGTYALLGTTVSPGFDYEDYEHGDPARLMEQYPDWSDAIRALTR